MDRDDAMRADYLETDLPPETQQHFTELLQRQPHPVRWDTLPAEVAEDHWRELDEWVTWLRTTFGLPPAILPPLWHRHDELIWELAALHGLFHDCYSPKAAPSAPILWMHSFAEARQRLRDWVSISGTRLDRDRPTRLTTWPGEHHQAPAEEVEILDRADDFEDFVAADVADRVRAESAL